MWNDTTEKFSHINRKTIDMTKDEMVVQTKMLRKELDFHLQILKNAERKSRERSIAVTKLQEAIMWLGMDLKDLNEPDPYPNSYNSANTIVDKTADGLKL